MGNSAYKKIDRIRNTVIAISLFMLLIRMVLV